MIKSKAEVDDQKTIDDTVGTNCERCILYRGFCYLDCILIDDDL